MYKATKEEHKLINVLGIETSCDETAAAVVRGGGQILSNVVFSQIALHKPYGGVVPEIASRNHVEYLPGVIEEAVSGSGVAWNSLDMVAVTNGPGLAGALLVGVSSAKALAQRLGVPLAAVNHLHAHIYSAFAGEGPSAFQEYCPFIVLMVSGGHTSIARVDGLGRYTVMGRTLDDAAGEAFDKAANLLGLGYPGGPAIERVSSEPGELPVTFPSGKIGPDYCPEGLDHELCFSFSGVKTSLLYYLQKHPVAGNADIAAIAAAFQEAVVSVLIRKTELAMNKTGIRNIAAVGGVSMNKKLRAGLTELAQAAGCRLKLADPALCGDNAAMVAALAGAWPDRVADDAASMDVCPAAEL